jgi:hypothetical protein
MKISNKHIIKGFRDLIGWARWNFEGLSGQVAPEWPAVWQAKERKEDEGILTHDVRGQETSGWFCSSWYLGVLPVQ